MTFHVISIFIMNVFRNYLLFVSFMELFGMYDFIELCFCRCCCRCRRRRHFSQHTCGTGRTLKSSAVCTLASLSLTSHSQNTNAIDCVIQFEWYSLKYRAAWKFNQYLMCDRRCLCQNTFIVTKWMCMNIYVALLFENEHTIIVPTYMYGEWVKCRRSGATGSRKWHAPKIDCAWMCVWLWSSQTGNYYSFE